MDTVIPNARQCPPNWKSTINYNWVHKNTVSNQQGFKVIMKIIIIITIYQEFFFCKISYKLCYHA